MPDFTVNSDLPTMPGMGNPQDLPTFGTAAPERVGVSTGEAVGAFFFPSTVIGRGYDAVTSGPSGETADDYNPWGYIQSLPKEDRELALRYSHEFEGRGWSPTRVDSVLSSIRRDLDYEAIRARAGTFQTVLGVGASFLDVSLLVPFSVPAKASIAGRAAIGAALAGGTAAVEEAIIGELTPAQDTLSPLMSIGTATLLGAGIGAFAKAYSSPANVMRARRAMEEEVQEVSLEPGTLSAAKTPGVAERLAAGSGEGGQEMNRIWTDAIPGLSSSPGSVAATTPNVKVREFLQKASVWWGRKSPDDVPEVTQEALYELTEAEAKASLMRYRGVVSEYDRARASGPIDQRLGRINQDEFDQHVALYLENPTYRTGDDLLDQHVARAANEVRPVFKGLFEGATKQRLFKTNRIAQLEQKAADLEARAAQLESDAATQSAGSSTPKGRVRKKDTKVAGKLREQADRVKRRAEIARKQAADVSNYFTQSWVRSVIMLKGLPNADAAPGRSMAEILARDFSSTSRISEEMVESAAGKVAKRTGTELDWEEQFIRYLDEGYGSLDGEIQKELAENIDRYALEEAKRIVQQFQRGGDLQMGMVDIEDVISSRFYGRKLDLSDEAKKALYEEGFLHANMDHVVMQNVRDVGAKVATMEKFGTLDLLNPEVSPVAADIEAEWERLLQAGKITPGRVEKERKVLRSTLDRMLNKHQFMDPGGAAYFMRNARRLSASTLLGQAGLSQLADLMTMAIHMGLKDTVKGLLFRSFKDTHRLVAGLPVDGRKVLAQGLDAAAGTIRVLDATGLQAPLGTPMVRGIGEGVIRNITGNIDYVLEHAARLTTYINLQHPMTVVARAVAQADFDQKLLLAMDKPDDLGEAGWRMLQKVGLSRKDIEAMRDLPRVEVEGLTVPDVEAWKGTAPGLRTKYLTALHRNASATTIQVSRGVSPYWMDSEIAKTLMQFQQFAFGINELVMRSSLKYGALPRDVNAASSILFGLSLGVMIEQAKQGVRGEEITPVKEMFATPARAFGTIYNSVDRAGLLSFVAPYSQVGVRFLGAATGQDFFGTTGRYREAGFVGLIGGPSLGLIRKAEGVTSAIGNHDWQRAAYHGARLLPFSNMWFLDGALRRTLGDN